MPLPCTSSRQNQYTVYYNNIIKGNVNELVFQSGIAVHNVGGNVEWVTSVTWLGRLFHVSICSLCVFSFYVCVLDRLSRQTNDWKCIDDLSSACPLVGVLRYILCFISCFFFFFYLTQAVAYMKLALTQMLAHNAMHRVHWQADIFADAWITCTQRGGARQAFKHSRAESVCSEPLHSTPDDQLNCSCYNWPITFHRINDIANAMNHARIW